MTIHKKGKVSKMKNAGAEKNVATTSTTSDVATTETVEVVSSTSVEESSQVKKSKSKSSMVEVTSSSREVIMDSKGNIIKVIETPPQTIQQNSSSRRTGKSSQDFIAGEQVQSIKQAKTTHEIPREHATSLSESRAIQGEATERASQSMQAQSQSVSHSMVQQSSSSSVLVESSSAGEDHSEHRSTVVVSHDIKNAAHAPVLQTSSRSTESTHVSSETSEAVMKDGQTVSSTMRIRETGEKIDDNGRMMSTSSREVDSEHTVTPSNVTVIKNTDDIKRTGDKSTRSDSKLERSNIEISTRCNKPGQSTWDGTFVYEKPATPKGKNAVDKTVSVSSKIHGDTKDSETSTKITQEASTEEASFIDQIVSSSSSVTRDSKTVVDENQRSTTTHLRDITSEKATEKADTTDFGEKSPKRPVRHSKPGDSTWDGSFLVEKITTQPKRRNDSDVNVFHHGRGDDVVETTQRRDFKEKSADGTYEKESSETMRVVKGVTDSTRFISEERHDVSRESSIRVDGTPSSKDEHSARVSSSSQRRPGDSSWNGEFVYEKSQDDVKTHPSDVTVVRRTEKSHDSVDVQDVSEEQNVAESVSTSYIVEYAISSDKKNVEKVTSVSEAILEEDGPEDRITRGPESPERQTKVDTTSRCYKPGQSTWDGTFVHERPVTPDRRRRPEDRRAVKTVDIRDVTEDNSINEADVTSTSYIVEHSSSQQSFSDVRDANMMSTMYETVVYEGRPVETTIRFDGFGDTSRGKVSTTERRTSPSPRPRSPEKIPKDRDLRSTKPGSSTWDGTFVVEKSQEKKRPPSRESIDGRLPDKHSADGKKTLVDTSKKHISETALDLRDVTQNVSSTSEIAESSVVMEQSRMHESYTDSSNLDFSTTSVETVIIHDGQPATTQKTVTIQEGFQSVAKRLPSSDVITTTDVKETTVKSLEKKEPGADDRSYRPLKPGSSTWDGSFVYEKSKERRPSDKKSPKDVYETVDKQSPIKEKPTGNIDRRTVTILDTSKDITTADHSTSSVTVEQTFVADSETYDSSNISKIFIKGSAEDKIHEIDYEKPRQLLDGKPKPSPRQHPEDIKEPKHEKPEKSPVDRTHRPSKPGASTWDGSFVYEKPEEKRPDRKIPKDTAVIVDKRTPTKGKPSDIADHRASITILNTSKDVSSSADYTTSSVTVEQTYATDSKTYDLSNVSKIYIKDSSEDKVHPIDYERPKQPSGERPKPSPRQRPEDTTESKDEKPQKSPVDRTHRPSKPGASTWDGSFVYEKPQDSRKKPTSDEPAEIKQKPADERRPIEKEKKPVDRKEKAMPTPISRKPTDKETPRDVTEIRYIEDVADITQADITRTSEVLQQSYVIDQSSRFTSVQDVRDVTDKRVVTEFTTDVRKDVRDVTESTKEFIDKEQVTSMVARDVVDNTRFVTITGPASRSPADFTRKPSPEQPGYPRGIPGLREDDRPKSIPIAGKPRGPPQREKSPQRPTEHGRPSEVRPKSPEKFRDHVSPTRNPQPAAGKPSRPEEKPIASRKLDKESGPAKPKPSRLAEKPEKPKKSEQDKPKRGDQSPDSLDEDVVYPKSVPAPDVLPKIPLKEQCICELCTCGRHRCPHNLPQEHLEFYHEEPLHTVTSYRQDYDEKRVEKQMKFYHEDHLHTEGEFIGQRRTDYVATKGERAPVKKPQDHLKPEGEFFKRPKEEAPIKGERAPVKKPQDNLRPEGEFVGKPREEAPKYGERAPITKPRDNLKFEGDFDTTTTTELVFTGTPGERPIPIRRNTYTKIEGDFTDETTSRSQYIDHHSIQRAEIIKRTDNLTVGEGEFTGTSHIKEDFQTHIIEREPQWRPKYSEDTDRFYSKTDITDSTTTTQEQFRTFDQTDYKSTTVIKRADNLRPEGSFEALPHTKDDYITPILLRRPEPQKPKDNLKPEGPFEGRPKDDYVPKRGERYEVKRPEDNLRPEGPFEGRPKDDYKPTRGERADVKKPQDNLKPEGPFQGRPKDDFIPKTAERPEVKRPKDNLRPEGDFTDRPKGQYTPGEKRTPIRHADNLYPEGDFERPEPIPYGPGDRASIVRHPDNLFPSGEFPDREVEPFKPAERRTPIKQIDNLRPEGDFVGRPKDDYRPTRGERADVKRPEDNLRPEGPFEGRPKDDYSPKRAERPEVKRPEDNLRPEGDFERPEKSPIGPAERRTPIKHPDNLRPEGKFERPRHDGYRPAEKPEVKKPVDNLRPEGEFERPRPEKYAPAEKRTPVKHPDNLKPEGEFIGKPKRDFIPTKGDRADVKRPEDNLKPEGPFEGRPKDDYRPVRGERMDIVKRTDNLRMEGDIETYRSRDEYTDFLIRERSEITKYQDNLRMEGEFIDTRTRDDFKIVKGERMDVVKHRDNLKPEGPFEGRPKDDYSPKKAERPEIKKPEDNLKPEGDFVRRPKEEAPKRGERADVKKPKDNLRPEGDFERPEKKPIGPAERRSPIKHFDNLKPEGDFERPIPEEFKPAERPVVKKPHDNLKPEGEFVSRPKEEAPKKGERADVKKPQDNLRPEGDFERPEKKPIGPAERRSPIKHSDNLKSEGEFERPKPEEFRPAERPVVKKPHDNLKPEGEFVSRPKEKVPKKGDRADVKKPKDNLKPEGDFERPEKTPIGPAERRTPIKHPDNLKPEGEFERPEQEGYRPAERPEVKKPTDNLKPEGDFERPHPEKYTPAEKRTPVKYSDNLKPEGEFIGRPKKDFIPTKGDRADIKKPEDNLRPEGPFEGRPKDDYLPVRGERMDVVKRTDNLRMEGDIETYRSRDEYTDFLIRERTEITKYQDNLRMEGEFIDTRTRDDFKIVKGERMDVVKHRDNLRPEGPFEGRPKDDYSPKKAERPEIKKPEDNLKPEGDFIRRPKEEAPKRGERADVKKPKDNLQPEGDFERPEKKPIGPAERRSPIKHSDNLKPEGEFERPIPKEFKPAERPIVKKPHDNLKPEGEFVSRPREPAPKRGDRADIKKPQDNLRSEGDFERPEKKPIGPAERRTPIKHADNLKPEGEFVGKPKEEAPIRGDRADVKRPADNLKPEGEFERPEKAPIRPAEKRVPIKHPDNLRPEGEFEKRPKEKTPVKGDRADVTRPKDNLRPEGEFVRPQKSPIGPAERRTPIRHEDNLHPEGEFVGRPKDDFIPKRADRPIQKKPKDNLKPEGEFVGKPKDDYKPTKGERTEIVVHQDNLKMEGDIDIYRSRDDYVTTSKRERVDIVHHEDNLKMEGEFVDIHRRDDYRVTRGERSEIIKRDDNLYPEGDFERPEKAPIGPAERRSPIKHPDNLKPEGDFVQRPKETAPIKGDRAAVKKPKDNLKPEGEFERPAKSPIGPGERRSPIKHPDNLHLEGEFVGRPKKETPLKGDRADVKKPKDNLHPEGEFAKRSPKKVEPAERRTPIKHEDNLHPEGDFYMVPKDDFTPKRGDRSPVKKPQDNLRPEGEMKVSPKDDYKYVNGERVEVRRHEDHLRMEGQMDIHRSRDDYKKITRVEKVDVKRHEDNLRMEGEFIDVRRKDDYVHMVGERVPIKKHPDNLRPEGDFDRPQKTVIGPAERRSPIKHPDNLKPQGDFERRTPGKIGPGERRSPIRHADNLKPEGDFVGRPRDDFTPKRAERAEVVRREDNLKMTGGFEGTTSHKSTYTVVRGERADIKSHEDNLKISTGTMETKTTNRDTYTPSKHEPSPAGKTVNRRRHMESSISLGDDTTTMTTTNQRNYNTYTKRAGKDIAAKMSHTESDTRKTVESQTLADGTVVTTVKRTTTSAQSDQRAVNAQTHHQQAQHITDRRATQTIDVSPSGPQPVDSRKMTSQLVSNQHHEQHQRTHLSEQHLRSQNMQSRRIDDRSITEGLNHRGQFMRGEDTSRYAIDATHGELHRQQHQQQQQHHVERHHQEMTKRDYVNAQHMESRQRTATKQHEQHTISSQARYNSNSPEFRQSINGQTTVERSQVDPAAKFSHHRKNVISSSSADVSNAVLHRRGAASSTEALHTISSTAADQRKSISNLAESGQYISNSSQSNDRRSLTSLHRSSKEINPWASSSYERPQRIVRQDNLTVGGKFYSQSEAKSYGNFSQSTQKVERVQRQANASHINLGDGSTVSSNTMYKKEFVPRHRGPCPATLLEAKQAPFKHTRDTPKHKFYMPVVSN
ncbi:PREDICTED: titin [Wasmannia auropunctata]|uniref:titin n=1 Tax=Wasmannia auropunctata TaxID=64793 RepID=UPI0005EEEAB3|nr:PREDICTED: titin [Wasmannia auropunctata]